MTLEEAASQSIPGWITLREYHREGLLMGVSWERRLLIGYTLSIEFWGNDVVEPRVDGESAIPTPPYAVYVRETGDLGVDGENQASLGDARVECVKTLRGILEEKASMVQNMLNYADELLREET
jgi:hypothetical protein